MRKHFLVDQDYHAQRCYGIFDNWQLALLLLHYVLTHTNTNHLEDLVLILAAFHKNKYNNLFPSSLQNDVQY